MDMKRVAVTGIGMVTPLGLDTACSWDGFAGGRSAVRRIESYDPTGEKVVVAAEVSKSDAETLASGLPPDVRDRTSRFVHFATAAARQALEHAGNPQLSAPERFGCICGVGFGEPLPSDGYKVGPTTIIKAMPNGAPAWIAILNGLKGPNFSCSSACASGAHAIGTAFDQVRIGRATGMLAGGVDTVITRDVMRTYAWMRALNTAKDEEPQRMSRPFDKTRRGFVLGEGSAFLMLEEWEHARARGARILCEMKGFCATADAYNIVAVSPDGEGMSRAMNGALQDADLAAEAVAYISAHGTSTKMNDKEETHAIRVSFGKHADKLMVSSQKSMIGHAMGGAGAIEAAVTALTVVHQTATPTINLREPDPECDLDYVPNEARRADIPAAMNNSFGFGGHNSSMIFARVDG
jgi:3-oxoacyl-[acyl-carrier-protein] synthase II